MALSIGWRRLVLVFAIAALVASLFAVRLGSASASGSRVWLWHGTSQAEGATFYQLGSRLSCINLNSRCKGSVEAYGSHITCTLVFPTSPTHSIPQTLPAAFTVPRPFVYVHPNGTFSYDGTSLHKSGTRLGFYATIHLKGRLSGTHASGTLSWSNLRTNSSGGSSAHVAGCSPTQGAFHWTAQRKRANP